MKKEKDWKRCTGVLVITSVCGKYEYREQILLKKQKKRLKMIYKQT